ncbi:MAG TPA: GGDEF domain-containing protein [Terriglobales bacterium]|nr:GGDEF domain-containing protein [Terriglobales bacterium]
MRGISKYRGFLSGSAWVLASVYALIALWDKPSFRLTVFGDFAQLFISGLIALAFASHLATTRGRVRSFWALMASGAILWFISQACWAYLETILHIDLSGPSVLDIILFLHLVPMMAALATLPHEPRKMPPMVAFSLAMVAVWWMYLYSFIVLPWQYVAPNLARYGPSFNVLYSVEDVAFIVALGVLVWWSRGPWRSFYRRLLIGSLTYTISSHIINVAIDKQLYYTGSAYDIPFVFSIAWICWAAASAKTDSVPGDLPEEGYNVPSAGWITKMSIVALLSVPLLAGWTLEFSRVAEAVQRFRVLVSLATIVAMAAMLFAKQHVLGSRLQQSLADARLSFLELARAREALEYQATHDAMTGVMNRATVVAALERELARASRSGKQLAAMLIDLDHFKQINDQFGHHAGDIAIIASSTRMQDCVRSHDYVGRYGGEEFLVIIPDCDEPSASHIAERMRHRISGAPVVYSGRPIEVTATLGVAMSEPGDSPESLLRRADLALYRGKEIGRDTVQFSRTDAASPEPEVSATKS